MVALIFCQVISGELLALIGALGTAIAVSWTFGGSVIGFLGDIVVTGGAGVILVGAAVAGIPAAAAILLALGLTIPFHIPI